jgi:hypothetical protein
MNSETELSKLAPIITSVANKSTGKIHVVMLNDEITVVSSTDRIPPCDVIATYSAEDARQGLTVHQWRKLAARIKRAKEKTT